MKQNDGGVRRSGRDPLPVDRMLPEVIASLRQGRNLVVTAEPGAGKTTRIPRAVQESGITAGGEILVLEPRRIAARLAALRVAEEMGEKPGATVGYSVRFESVGGSETRIRYVTEGVFTRRMVADPELRGVAVVFLDEFHERHLATDLALAFLRRLQLSSRPELRIVVMSATIDPAPVADYLGGAPVLSSSEILYEVEIGYEAKPDDRPLEIKAAAAALALLDREHAGDILIFLPGAGEIRRTAEALGSRLSRHAVRVVALHGDMPMAEQAQALRRGPEQKVILATNVAETSITVPGVTAVIDSGMVRRASFSHWSGLPGSQIVKASQSSARQRAGRAGRTGPGRVLRLYTQHDFETRPRRDLPEIRRSDLAEAVLALQGAGVRNIRDFPWFEDPPEGAISAAEELLARLGALDERGAVSGIGRRMARLPLHPRLARLLLEGEALGARREGALLAAILSERDMRLQARTAVSPKPPRRGAPATGESDLLELRDCFGMAQEAGFDPARLERLGLDPRAVDRIERIRRQILRLTPEKREASRPAEETDDALMRALLAAFPDRVASRRARGSRELLLACGGTARLSEASVVHHADFMVAVDAEERGDGPGSAGTLVRLASTVRKEWLDSLRPGLASRSANLAWNDKAGRVDEVRRTTYGELTLGAQVRPAQPSRESSVLLADAALRRPDAAFQDYGRFAELRARLSVLFAHFPSEMPEPPGESELRGMIVEACAGRTGLSDLRSLSLAELLLRRLTAGQRSVLEREAPERIALGARRVKVNYEGGKPPWIAARLQDFFGMRAAPAICRGRVNLTIHLLAPNGRAVQVTQDLAGFWRNHYPAVRRELMRRYPKHRWPEAETLFR